MFDRAILGLTFVTAALQALAAIGGTSGLHGALILANTLCAALFAYRLGRNP